MLNLPSNFKKPWDTSKALKKQTGKGETYHGKTKRHNQQKGICRQGTWEGSTAKKAALQGVGLFWDALMDCLAEGKEVNFYGIGHFGPKTVRGGTAKNPKTGEPCTVPEHKAMKFYPSRTLADRICGE